MIFYWSAIVNIALSGTVSELFDDTTTVDILTCHRLEVNQGHPNPYHSKIWVRFPIRFNSNYGSILHHLRDEARYWSKIVTFHTPLYSMSPFRGFPSFHRNIAIPFGMEKLEWWG